MNSLLFTLVGYVGICTSVHYMQLILIFQILSLVLIIMHFHTHRVDHAPHTCFVNRKRALHGNMRRLVISKSKSLLLIQLYENYIKSKDFPIESCKSGSVRFYLEELFFIN